MPNLNDAFAWIRDLYTEVARLKSGAMLENSSIAQGRMRFIGGLLRVDSGGRVEIVGTLQVDGESTVTGQFTVDGPFTFNGDGSITGTLTITGPVTISGDVDLTGLMRVTGDIEVIGDGKITIGGIVIGEGKITAGGMTINPDTNGGQIEFGNGRTINAGSNYLGIYDGDRFVLFNASGVTVFAAGSTLSAGTEGVRVSDANGHSLSMDEDGITFDGARLLQSADEVAAWYGEDAQGRLVRVSPSVGGPMGSLTWPFPPSMVTSEYGPREAPTEGASTFHEGLDFGAAEGTPIPSAGPGVVEFAGENGGFGNCVVINHGNGLKTRYAHMQTLPYVSAGQTVARMQIIGPVGQTGISRGAHLHFEVEVNGVKVNPRTKLPAA